MYLSRLSMKYDDTTTYLLTYLLTYVSTSLPTTSAAAQQRSSRRQMWGGRKEVFKYSYSVLTYLTYLQPNT